MEVVLKHVNLRLEALKYIKKVYKCLICNNYEFSFESDVLKHIEETHLDIVLTPKIKNEFSEKGMNQIENESKELKDIVPKPELIDAKFENTINHVFKNVLNNLNIVTSHKKNIHKGKKVYKCLVCSRDFSTKSIMTYHIKRIHEGKKFEKTFKCELCEKRIGSKGNLKRHIDVVHCEQKQFKCDTCEKQFSSFYNLKQHKKGVHEKEKPYHCNKCNFTTGYQKSFKEKKKNCN